MRNSATSSAISRAVLACLAAGALLIGGGVDARADGVVIVTDPGDTRIHTFTSIGCTPGQVYTGKPLTPCTATTTAGGVVLAHPPVIYANNVFASTSISQPMVSAGYVDPSGQYASSNAQVTFDIARAPATSSVSCPLSVPYTGSPVTPCTATVNAGGSSSEVDVRYTNNTGPGIASASPDTRLFTDPNYFISTGQQIQFTIGVTTTTAVTCTAATYTGSPITNTCTATTTGAGDFSATPTLSFTNNTNAGTASVTATYAGDGTGGHLPSSKTATFTIAKAPTSLSVSCGIQVFTGAPIEPCGISVGGVGTLTGVTSAIYTDNVNVGPASVTVSYPGDANHESATATGTFAITPAPVVVTVTCPASADFTGTPLTPCTATVTGPLLSTTATVTYTDNVYTGTATATAIYPAGGNYLAGTGTGTFRVVGFTLKGYYQPVDMSTADTTVWNTVKAGSTVPLKFEAFLPNGTEITTTTTLGATFTTTGIACTTTAVTDDVEQTSTDATSLRYDPTSGQFIQNWKTPKGAPGCYRATTTTADHSQLTAYFILR
ncbi:MAG: PxKF domain-containing protein [Lapillicoccus sp.]